MVKQFRYLGLIFWLTMVCDCAQQVLEQSSSDGRNTIFNSIKKNPIGTTSPKVLPEVTLFPKIEDSDVVKPTFVTMESSVPSDVTETLDSNSATLVKNDSNSNLSPIDHVVSDNSMKKFPISDVLATTDSYHASSVQKLDKNMQHNVVKNATLEKEVIKEPNVLYQATNVMEDSPTIAFNFEDASLSNLVSYIETVHNITFIGDDIITNNKTASGIAGHKISFRTNKNLTRKESWDLFLNFMHIAGFDIVPLVQHGFYRIVPLTKASTEPIPTYIGVDADILPDSDMIIRFVYFARNIDPKNVTTVLKSMQSGSAKLDVYTELKALIFTDRACSIKALMKIVSELDRAALPEVLSVIKLKRANVEDVIALYKSLRPPASAEAAQQPPRAWVPIKKEATIEYFPSDVTLVGDKRTNSLILLGTVKDVQRIEDFITKYIDVAIDRTVPPIFTYRLQYTNAADIEKILSKIVQYGAGTAAGQYGGVRDGRKYFQKMTIVSDSFTNSLIINSTAEDFEMLKPLIEELDVPQKQVGLEVLIVQVSDVDTKSLGAQISGPNGLGSNVQGASPYGPTFLPAITAQTSGIPLGTPTVVSGGGIGQPDFSLKSSLASLLGNPLLNQVGSVLVTFGQPIWAIFSVLKTITSTHIVANPFLVVSNNNTASIESGQERRQAAGTVYSASATKATGFTPVQATLNVKITPQINKGNIINLSIYVQNNIFTESLTQEQTVIANGGGGSPQDQKSLTTFASVANGETLVLGGLMSENYATTTNGVPFLQNIPLIGWFFKSKARTVTRSHFLIFICPRLIDEHAENTRVDKYTKYKMNQVQEQIDLIDANDWYAAKDPIEKTFFESKKSNILQQFHVGHTFENAELVDGRLAGICADPTTCNQKGKKSLKKKKALKSAIIKDIQMKASSQKKNKDRNVSLKTESMYASVPQMPKTTHPVDDGLSRVKNAIAGSVQLGKEV